MEALLPLATVPDLERRLGREITDTEIGRAEAVLDEASVLVRDASGKDWLKLTTVAPIVAVVPNQIDAPHIVHTITLRVADRAWRNPEGFASESAGDYSYQRNPSDAARPRSTMLYASPILPRLWMAGPTAGA